VSTYLKSPRSGRKRTSIHLHLLKRHKCARLKRVLYYKLRYFHTHLTSSSSLVPLPLLPAFGACSSTLDVAAALLMTP